jgi:uncharacterized protein YbjT (DUF2867 family)
MTISRMTVLVVGATGGIGCLVAEEALRQGHTVRALVRAARVKHFETPGIRIY